MIRANSTLRQHLNEFHVEFLEHAAGAVQRILPHVTLSTWKESGPAKTRVKWKSSKRTAIVVTLSIRAAADDKGRSLRAEVTRTLLPGIGGKAGKTLDEREKEICNLIAERISEFANNLSAGDGAGVPPGFQGAVKEAFDESVVAKYVESYHRPTQALFDALHRLSEQSYENKALTFGCILDASSGKAESGSKFPSDYLASKKYKALSDGYRTAYHVSAGGKMLGFIELDLFAKKASVSKHYYPDWAEPIARASRPNRYGIALSRQGDILVFDKGSLRFTYRFGRWQYWNHAHLIYLLRDRARAQRVPTKILGRVVGAIYRAALDVSFRRSGGLFVILHNRKFLKHVVREGDAIGDERRSTVDHDFDSAIGGPNVQSLHRAVLVELASLDGAVVMDNSGRIRAYGAVLQPKKRGRLRGTEGSRTKAAIGASNYGLAVKISSDGDITVYHDGKEFIHV